MTTPDNPYGLEEVYVDNGNSGVIVNLIALCFLTDPTHLALSNPFRQLT